MLGNDSIHQVENRVVSTQLDSGEIGRIRQRVRHIVSGNPLLREIGNTPMVPLPAPLANVELFAKLESRNPSGSLKDRIVLYLVADAQERKAAGPDVTLVEGSSGNTGISLAMIGAALGYRALVFMPDNVSVERRDLMRAYGAQIELTPGELGTDGAIEAAREMGRSPGHYWIAQHESDVNVLAHYDTTGAEILEQCPGIDVFVAPSGTTGTLIGTSMRLKEVRPDVEVVAVWPEEWIMGLRRPEGEKRPLIYRDRWVDRVVEVSDADAQAAAAELAHMHGLLVGPSSGAAWVAARRVGREHVARGRTTRIAICFPDEGARYLSRSACSESFSDSLNSTPDADRTEDERRGPP